MEKISSSEEGYKSELYRKTTKTLALISALWTISASAEDISVNKSSNNKPKIEDVYDSSRENYIDESKITDSSKWSRIMMDVMYADEKKIKTTEDANWLLKMYYGPYVSEYYIPTQGNLKDGPYGIKLREYSEEDIKLILQKSKELKKLLINLHTKFNTEGYEKNLSQIDDIITKTEAKASYTGQKQQELADRYEKFLNQR